MVFSEAVTQQVWEKATVTEPNDPKLWRKDQCGAWIHRSAHGNRDSQYGWEIDHIQPVSQGGGDEVSNLRPLQWQNNADRATGRLNCPVTASGVNNVQRT